jgi:hypothetical protein
MLEKPLPRFVIVKPLARRRVVLFHRTDLLSQARLYYPE